MNEINSNQPLRVQATATSHYASERPLNHSSLQRISCIANYLFWINYLPVHNTNSFPIIVLNCMPTILNVCSAYIKAFSDGPLLRFFKLLYNQ